MFEGFCVLAVKLSVRSFLMRTDRRGVIRGGIGIAIGMLVGSDVEAETALTQDAVPTPSENPPTLAACLPFLDWAPAERGPLLIVAPERARLQGLARIYNPGTRQYDPRPTSGLEAVKVGRNGFRLATIAPRYRRKLAAVGSLSTVVPETMAVLRYKNLPEPDIWQGMRPENRPQLFLSTLSSQQWRRLMSEGGLGMGDLKRDQQTMFASLFPEDMKVYKMERASADVSTKQDPVPLSGLTAADLRLRIYQDLQWSFQFVDAKRGTLGMETGVMRSSGSRRTRSSFPQTQTLKPFPEDGEEGGYGSGVPAAFGVTLMEAQTNRPKPSDIDYDASNWNVGVVMDGAKTVGDLVARIREASGVEIYADKRYAALPIYTRTTPNTALRAGDLLKALAYSVTGTFRRVASGSDAAFVMTDDRVGAGVRLAAIGSWMHGAQQQLMDTRKRLTDAVKAENVRGNSRWSTHDDMVPSGTLLEKMAALQAKPRTPNEPPGARLIPLADLPVGIRGRIQMQQRRWREQIGDANDDFHRPIREDGVQLNTQLKIAVLIPGVGPVPFSNNDMQLGSQGWESPSAPETDWYRIGATPPDMTAPLPVRLGANLFEKRLLTLTVQSADDARKAAQLARDKKFTGVLLDVGANLPDAVAEWLTVAREAAPDLKIWVKAPLFWEATSPAADMPPHDDTGRFDRNILGETYAQSLRRPVFSGYGSFRSVTAVVEKPGEYIDLSDKAAVEAVRARAVSLVNRASAADGIVFTHTSPPGYNGQTGGNTVPADRELGYLPAFRLAFLRESGADPIDLSPFGNLQQVGWVPGIDRMETRIQLPFLPDLGPSVRNWTINDKPATELGAKDLYPLWYDFRAKQLRDAGERIRTSVLAENSKTELFVQSNPGWGGGISPWSAPATPPVGATAPVAPKAPATSKPPVTPPAFQWVSFAYNEAAPPGTASLQPKEQFARQAARAFSWVSKPRNPSPSRLGAPAATPTKYGLILDLTQAPLSDAEELLSQISLQP
jgi:hypothetical protein